MKIYLNSIDGIPDAFAALLMSKRNWNIDSDRVIRYVCRQCLDERGFLIDREKAIREAKKNSTVFQHDLTVGALNSIYDTFEDYMNKLTKWGKRHITLLKFIDLSITVEGLHRAGQDDWDSHAKRFDNRIIRNSTRIKGVDFNYEMSDYYKDKIIPTDLAANKVLGIELPDEIEYEGKTYVKRVNGYILKGYEDNNDVKRGLYMLSIPSNFIFRVNLAEWSHIYKERNEDGGANPEVKQCCEMIADELNKAHSQFTRSLWKEIKN